MTAGEKTRRDWTIGLVGGLVLGTLMTLTGCGDPDGLLPPTDETVLVVLTGRVAEPENLNAVVGYLRTADSLRVYTRFDAQQCGGVDWPTDPDVVMRCVRVPTGAYEWQAGVRWSRVPAAKTCWPRFVDYPRRRRSPENEAAIPNAGRMDIVVTGDVRLSWEGVAYPGCHFDL